MKNIIFLGLFFITSNMLLAQTTLTEYNYITKGYKDDLDKGKDVKSGYYMGFMSSFKSSLNIDGKSVIRSVEIYLFNDTINKRTAGLLAIVKREDTGSKAFLCIPSENSNADILKLASADFYAQVKNVPEEAYAGYQQFWNSLNIIGSIYMSTPRKRDTTN